MANSIALAEKYQPLLDEVYKTASKTIDLESAPVLFDGAQTVKVLKVTLDPLSNYSRNSGFTDGSVTANWESMKLTQDRGKEFNVDTMDNEETLDVMAGNLLGTFIRQKVVPEIDAYRFATLAQKAGIYKATPGTLTDATVGAAIDDAMAKLTNDEVPLEDRILYLTPAVYQMLKRAQPFKFANGDTNLNRNFDIYDGMKVVQVPESRFYTKIDVKAGTSSGDTGGFAKASDGTQINFMIVAKSAVIAVAKHVRLRVFTPDENQEMDAYKFQYRIYHDEFVYDNKVAGIYLHAQAAA